MQNWKSIINRLFRDRLRGGGETATMVEYAKRIGAVYVCASAEQADRIRRQYEIETLTINRMENMGKFNKPFVIDHYAIQSLLNSIIDDFEDSYYGVVNNAYDAIVEIKNACDELSEKLKR